MGHSNVNLTIARGEMLEQAWRRDAVGIADPDHPARKLIERWYGECPSMYLYTAGLISKVKTYLPS